MCIFREMAKNIFHTEHDQLNVVWFNKWEWYKREKKVRKIKVKTKIQMEYKNWDSEILFMEQKRKKNHVNIKLLLSLKKHLSIINYHP